MTGAGRRTPIQIAIPGNSLQTVKLIIVLLLMSGVALNVVLAQGRRPAFTHFEVDPKNWTTS